ncbi:uncharacterized protein LOC113855137 [Abrus precatorius]|uniref:Uncharacterized protein LOC113855137 n=1 Tax=Abrus precatorius TaxID=3816 RepID=A0A8B8KFA8_ABRPR|nr:uncharacterized protein LOC113855137 [Abrus precatorius]
MAAPEKSIKENVSSKDEDQSQNPTSPYYLHPGENPASIISDPQLNGVNYHSWSKNFKRALLSKNKYKFVDGSIKEPDKKDPLWDAWERCNNTIVSWIIKTLPPEIAQSVIYIDNAQELWEDFKDRFSKGDHFRVSDLLQDLHSIRQGDRGISTYYTNLKTLWEELEVLRPLPSCTCSIKCSCDLMKTVKKYKDYEYVICFLKGLNDQYSHVRSQILMMEELPLIKKAFPLLIQQERQHVGAIESRVLATATDPNFGWRGSSTGRGGNQGSRGRGRSNSRGVNGGNIKVCSFCGKERHTVETCYCKHGFPPNFKFKNRSTNPSVNSLTSEQNNNS